MRENVHQPPRRSRPAPKPARHSGRSADHCEIEIGGELARRYRRPPTRAAAATRIRAATAPTRATARACRKSIPHRLNRVVGEPEASSQERIGVFKPARQRIVGMEQDAVGHPALQEPPIEPAPPPARHGTGASTRAHSARKNSGRSAEGGRCRVGPSSDTCQPRSRAMLAAYCAGPSLKTAVPATSTLAPATIARLRRLRRDAAIHFERDGTPDFLMRSAAASIFASWLSMKLCPPNPGLTVMMSTRSTRSRTLSIASIGVPGLSTTPGRLP